MQGSFSMSSFVSGISAICVPTQEQMAKLRLAEHIASGQLGANMGLGGGSSIWKTGISRLNSR